MGTNRFGGPTETVTLRMKKVFCMALTVMLSATALIAQTTDKPFRISGQVKGLRDSSMVLAHWYRSGTQYIPKDTAKIDAEGRFVFEGLKALPQGLYLVLTPKQRYMEIIVDDNQTFSFVTDTASFIKSMKITGSKENEKFYEYQQSLAKLYDESQAIEMQKKLRNDAVSATMFQKQQADLSKKANDYRLDFIKANKGMFAAKLLEASAEPDVPTAPKASNGRPDSVWTFNYYKAHYWDGFDLTDERFLLTPIYQRKLERYIKELTVQQSDSLIKEAEFLAAKTKPNKEMNLYTIYWITSEYERPKVLGTDEVFIHMAEKYYLTGIMPLSDSAALAKVKEKIATIKPLLIGKPFPPMSVSDTLRRPINFPAIKADYLIVFLYDVDCGHCRKAIPEVKKYIDANKGKGVEILAVPTSNASPDAWKKLVREFKIYNWINGYDYEFRTDFRHQYDVFTTPTVYVLGKDKKIIARGVPAEQVGDFIDFYKRQQAAKATSAAPTAKKEPKAGK